MASLGDFAAVMSGVAGGTLTLFLLIALPLLFVLLPFSAYAAQKWAYKTYRETQKISATLDEIAELLSQRDKNGI
jgi:hypothetical protein